MPEQPQNNPVIGTPVNPAPQDMGQGGLPQDKSNGADTVDDFQARIDALKNM